MLLLSFIFLSDVAVMYIPFDNQSSCANFAYSAMLFFCSILSLWTLNIRDAQMPLSASIALSLALTLSHTNGTSTIIGTKCCSANVIPGTTTIIVCRYLYCYEVSYQYIVSCTFTLLVPTPLTVPTSLAGRATGTGVDNSNHTHQIPILWDRLVVCVTVTSCFREKCWVRMLFKIRICRNQKQLKIIPYVFTNNLVRYSEMASTECKYSSSFIQKVILVNL